MLMRIEVLVFLLATGFWTDGQAQEVGGKLPQAPPPMDGDFVNSPPKELLRSKNGKIELIKVGYLPYATIESAPARPG